MATINVALIGQGFMGRSHSNAWGQVAKFFKPPLRPVMHTVFGQPEENPQVFACNWGWQNASTDWQQVVKSPEIGLVGSIAITATVLSCRRKLSMSRSINELFPTPGGPVMPRMRALPVRR